MSQTPCVTWSRIIQDPYERLLDCGLPSWFIGVKFKLLIYVNMFLLMWERFFLKINPNSKRIVSQKEFFSTIFGRSAYVDPWKITSCRSGFIPAANSQTGTLEPPQNNRSGPIILQSHQTLILLLNISFSHHGGKSCWKTEWNSTRAKRRIDQTRTITL